MSYTNIKNAKRDFKQVMVAKFTNLQNVIFETSSEMECGISAKLFDGNIFISSLDVKLDDKVKTSATLDVSKAIVNFDYNAQYNILVDGYNKIKYVDKMLLLTNTAFKKQYESYNGELGAIYTKESTTFRVWSPLAAAVNLNIYLSGNEKDKTPALPGKSLAKMNGENWNGVWETVVEGDLNKYYYTYSIVNYGYMAETIDIYAKAAGINGDRGMIVDLESTNPKGWHNDKYIFQTNDNYSSPIIWELHVRDFSIHANSGMKFKGKYKAFTEQNTHLVGNDNVKTGIAYLRDLGITYVHLLPVYDFQTVDESRISDIDYDKKFNWGYDPKNYNLPEGSYSTDPTRGEVRIKEFKEMVQSIHSAGIGIIMDVVYNHTYTVSESNFSKSVPNYYYRTDESGRLTNGSGCGNETASEKQMFRKYMADSLVYWATEYHIDGFRFDLMALHDIETMGVIRESLDRIAVGEGTKILMYGEPWAAEQGTLKDGISANKENVKSLPNRVSIFSDTIRDGIRGNNNVPPNGGYINGGAYNDENMNYDRIKSGVQGGMYGGRGFINTASPRQQVIYASAHDNYTLYDQIALTMSGGNPLDLIYELYNDDFAARNRMAAAIMYTSRGIPFMQAGEEMGRTKFGNHNSYNSADHVNQLDWQRQVDFSDIYNYYKGMIAIRKEYSPLRDLTKASADNIHFLSGLDENVIGYIMKKGATDTGKWNYMVVLLNPNGFDKTVTISAPNFGSIPMEWDIIANKTIAGVTSLGKAFNTVKLQCLSAMVLVN